jgi:uncharacterized membrane protein YagU involved in acid resistance
MMAGAVQFSLMHLPNGLTLDGPMKRNAMGKNLAAGAAAGAVGTVIIQGLMAGAKKYAPQTLPPMKDDPGHFMVQQAERILPETTRQKVPEKFETFIASALHFEYGMTFGILYGLLGRPSPPRNKDGALLGIATWASGHLGWLPATKLAPPIWKQNPTQVISGIASHVLFGIATVSVFGWLQTVPQGKSNSGKRALEFLDPLP